MGYVLVPTVLSGAHEWTAHLTQLVLVWIAIVAMTSLVLRFGWDRQHAIAGALLLVAIAPFLPMASTAMPDILATAVALVAMERLAAWKAEQKWSQGAAAAIALGLAGFARAHLALLLPLAAFFLLESADPKEVFAQVRRRFWLWTPVLAGSVLLVAIIAITREHNLGHQSPSRSHGVRYIPYNLACLSAVPRVSFASCRLLAGEPFEEQIGASRNHPDRGGRRITWFVHSGGPARSAFVSGLLGSAALTDLLYEALDSAEHTGLFLMLWILIPLPIVYYFHLPSKYLLPCMPAVILLCFRLDGSFLGPGFPSRSHFIDCCRHRLFSSDSPLGRRVCKVRPGRYVSLDSTACCSRRKSMVQLPIFGLLVCAPGRGNTYVPWRPSTKARRSVGSGPVTREGRIGVYRVSRIAHWWTR